MKRFLLASLFMTCFVSMEAQFHGGSGTAEDPYLVANGFDLADIANYRTCHFKQTADIDLTEWIADNAPKLGWIPIGTTSAPFEGSYDGGNFTIRGLVINRPTMDNVGLFGYASQKNTIQNVIVDSPKVSGNDFTGVIVGKSNCAITSCHVISANIRGNGYVGGIAGYVNNSINNSTAVITSLNATASYSGGICGGCYGNIENCKVEAIMIKASAQGVGGIVGNNTGGNNYNINHCQVVAQTISCLNGWEYDGVGGISGTSLSQIKNSVAIVNMLEGTRMVGGITGYSSQNINNCYAFALIKSGQIAGGICSECITTNYKSYLDNCIYDGTIIAEKAAGIIENNMGGNPRCCLVGYAKIYGMESACGIQTEHYFSNPSNYNVENCVSLANIVSSKNSNAAYRISANTYCKNNKAFNQTKLYRNGTKIDNIVDDEQNGIAYGEKTLMHSSLYIGLEWDFNTVWTIQNGESYPYLQIQSEYPVVTGVTSETRATLNGTCKSNGTLYLMKEGECMKAPILDNKWKIDLGAVNKGDTIYVFAQTEGKMPSVVVRYVFNESSLNPAPQGIVGDANGDGVVDSADVTAIINYILGKPSASFNKTNADVNGDSEILIDDAVQTVQLIMNEQ